MAEVVYPEALLGEYYEPVGDGFRDYRRLAGGQMCWATVPFTEEQHRYWRPTNYDATGTSAGTFQIVDREPRDLYNRQLPLHSPKLSVHEEFLVVRSKKRPVLILAAPATSLPHPQRSHVVAVPCRSLTRKESDIPKLTPDQLLRVRSLEFPDCFFLPKAGALMPRDGVLRLNFVQPIPLGHLEPMNLRLTKDFWEVLVGQFEHLVSGRLEGPYAATRALLMANNLEAGVAKYVGQDSAI